MATWRSLQNRRAPWTWSGATTDGLIVQNSVVVGEDIYCYGIRAYQNAAAQKTDALYRYRPRTDSWHLVATAPTGASWTLSNPSFMSSMLYEPSLGKLFIYANFNSNAASGFMFSYNITAGAGYQWSIPYKWSSTNEYLVGVVAVNGWHYILSSGTVANQNRIQKINPASPAAATFVSNLNRQYISVGNNPENVCVGIGGIMYIVGGQMGSTTVNQSSKLFAIDVSTEPPIEYYGGSVSATGITSFAYPIVRTEGTKIYLYGWTTSYRPDTRVRSFDVSGGFVGGTGGTINGSWTTETSMSMAENVSSTSCVLFKGNTYVLGGAQSAGQTSQATRYITVNGSATDAPSSLTATASGNNVYLTWTDNSTDETSFQIWRKRIDETLFTLITDTVPAGQNWYLDTDTDISLYTYQYKVKSQLLIP